MLYQVLVSAWCLAIAFCATIRGQIVGRTPEMVLEKPAQFLNSENLAARTAVTLVNLDTTQQASGLVDSKLRFSFDNVALGSYELVVYSHAYSLVCDRYKILVDEESALAYEDFLDATEVGEPINITTKPLLISISAPKQYYDVRAGGIQQMVLNSPLGPIFKNKYYTAMFVFTVVMMIVPYLLHLVSPELSKQMTEMQKQGFQEKPEALEKR